jgi:hypothetical protein
MASLHKVQQGEGMIHIAAKYQFLDYQTIWDDAKNAQLKRQRPNPELLFPGDLVYIPDKKSRNETRGTGSKYTFQIRQKATQTIRIAVEDTEGKRLAGTGYTLMVAGEEIAGQTDGQGILQADVPVDEQEGELHIQNHVWPLKIAHLNPIEHTHDRGVSGVVARLRNLGYEPGPTEGTLDDEKTKAAIRAFQEEHGLPVDGSCTPRSATLARLIEKHGC